MRPFSNISSNFAANLHLLVDSIISRLGQLPDGFSFTLFCSFDELSYFCQTNKSGFV